MCRDVRIVFRYVEDSGDGCALGCGGEEMNALRQWLIRKLGGSVNICDHKWKILIEHYPTYSWDKWLCKRCDLAKDFPNSQPPIPIKTAICDLGDVHIVNR